MVFRNDYIFFRVETYFGLPPLPAQESVGRPRRPKRKKKPNHLRREKEVFLLPPLPTLLPSPPLLNVKNWRRKEERKKSGQSGEKKGPSKETRKRGRKLASFGKLLCVRIGHDWSFFLLRRKLSQGSGHARRTSKRSEIQKAGPKRPESRATKEFSAEEGR